MKRGILVLGMFVLASVIRVAPASAASILYYSDHAVGTDTMAAALSAVSGTHAVTSVADATAFVSEAGTGSYDLLIFFQQNSSEYDAVWSAVAAHIDGGGAAIAADWTRGSGHASPFGAGFTGGTNQTTVNVVSASLLAGISSPLSLYNPGWGVFSTGLSGAPCAATFGNGDCAIVMGNEGRTIFNGFLNDTFADGAAGTQLFVNEIDTVLGGTPVPEPATLLLLGCGVIGLAFRRRTSR